MSYQNQDSLSNYIFGRPTIETTKSTHFMRGSGARFLENCLVSIEEVRKNINRINESFAVSMQFLSWRSMNQNALEMQALLSVDEVGLDTLVFLSPQSNHTVSAGDSKKYVAALQTLADRVGSQL